MGCANTLFRFETEFMTIEPIRAFSDNYIWLITSGDRAAVVDPGDPAPVFDLLETRDLRLDTIIITHHHFDHTGGVTSLKLATGCRVIGPDNPVIGDIDDVMTEGSEATVLGNLQCWRCPATRLIILLITMKRMPHCFVATPFL